mmetsp:Transcript_40440/g.38923  ORF Transcript_40440/g.38923 Transcript_40440/m.38923 type:complete len:82 (+) Transcript_40440:195-440(+)
MHPLELGKTPASLIEGPWQGENFTKPYYVEINNQENWGFFMHMIPFPGPLEVPLFFMWPWERELNDFKFTIGPHGNFFSLV